MYLHLVICFGNCLLTLHGILHHGVTGGKNLPVKAKKWHPCLEMVDAFGVPGKVPMAGDIQLITVLSMSGIFVSCDIYYPVISTYIIRAVG